MTILKDEESEKSMFYTSKLKTNNKIDVFLPFHKFPHKSNAILTSKLLLSLYLSFA